MKNFLIYYLAILAPIGLLIWIAGTERSSLFAISLLLYAFPYRLLIDGWRLTGKGTMKWNELWKLCIPWYRPNYFKALYFSK